jgi:acyl dehydratase
MSEREQRADWSADTMARITPDHIERARLLVGYDEAATLREQISVASEDSIRAFALAYGSDNPLHCNPEYAEKTRWGGLIAPGTMAVTMGSPLRRDVRPPAMARAKKGLFKGIHQLHSGTEWQWYRRIQPGDRLYHFAGEESVDVKESQFAGITVLRVARRVYFNQRAEVAAVMRTLIIQSERETAAKRGKYAETPSISYTDEDLAAIDAIYAHETVRGAEKRFWEDVEIGDTLGLMAKGPITLTDIIAFHTTGFAMLPFGPVTGRLAYKRRQTMPSAFVKDHRGIPDIVMRMHWDDEWARALGSPFAYDYGFMRECWLEHYLTDWCGDDGILLSMRSEMRKFNYLGDVQKITGEIVDKKRDGLQATINLKVRFVNQRNETTVEANAIIALPSREHGDATYPIPPADLHDKAKVFLARHRELGGS